LDLVSWESATRDLVTVSILKLILFPECFQFSQLGFCQLRMDQLGFFQLQLDQLGFCQLQLDQSGFGQLGICH
jgi:hypothetical protein